MNSSANNATKNSGDAVMRRPRPSYPMAPPEPSFDDIKSNTPQPSLQKAKPSQKQQQPRVPRKSQDTSHRRPRKSSQTYGCPMASPRASNASVGAKGEAVPLVWRLVNSSCAKLTKTGFSNDERNMEKRLHCKRMLQLIQNLSADVQKQKKATQEEQRSQTRLSAVSGSRSQTNRRTSGSEHKVERSNVSPRNSMSPKLARSPSPNSRRSSHDSGRSSSVSPCDARSRSPSLTLTSPTTGRRDSLLEDSRTSDSSDYSTASSGSNSSGYGSGYESDQSIPSNTSTLKTKKIKGRDARKKDKKKPSVGSVDGDDTVTKKKGFNLFRRMKRSSPKATAGTAFSDV